MRILSFRTRIALLSLLISGLVLMSFGYFFLNVINTVGLERVDSELKTLNESQLRGPPNHPADHWERFDQSLGDIYGEEQGAKRIIRIEDRTGQVVYQSLHWPDWLQLSGFPPLEYPELRSSPPPRRDGPRPGLGDPPPGPGGRSLTRHSRWREVAAPGGSVPEGSTSFPSTRA